MKKIIGVVVLLLLIIIGCSSCTSVDTGCTGIKTRFGAVQDVTLQEGLNFKLPFVEKIVQMNNKTQKTNAKGNSASKDLQTVTYAISTNYRVEPDSAHTLYQKVGLEYEKTIVSPAIQESAKSVMAKYTAEELIQNRVAVSEGIREVLTERLKEYGIVVEAINIENFDFSAEFNKAIEAKQTAQQEALKAQQETIKIQEQANQKIIQAEAEAKANELLTKSIDDKILLQQYISKWDGKLPTVNGSEGNMFDLTNILNQNK